LLTHSQAIRFDISTLIFFTSHEFVPRPVSLVQTLYLKENQKTLSARKATITRPLGHSSPDPVPGIPKQELKISQQATIQTKFQQSTSFQNTNLLTLNPV
jgi:hypothetical protein